jgi:hypothetical protein
VSVSIWDGVIDERTRAEAVCDCGGQWEGAGRFASGILDTAQHHAEAGHAITVKVLPVVQARQES